MTTNLRQFIRIAHQPRGSAAARARAYFASDSSRAIQTALGLIWLLDGALQFQPFMYSSGFIQQITANAAGQPGWLAAGIRWGAHHAQLDPALFNTLFAVTHVLLGVGLLYRRTVKPTLAASIAWALVVWSFGEAFGMLFTGMPNPLTGAPGAVLLYAIIGLLVWPTDRPGGLLGVCGARRVWAVLWLAIGGMWLLGENSSANWTHGAILAAPSGPGWLTSLQHGAANAAKGNGTAIAVGLAILSAAIGIAVAGNWRPKLFIALAVAINLAYWTLGQGLGGIFTGSSTDPNSAPLFILLAFGLYSLTPIRLGEQAHRRELLAHRSLRPRAEQSLSRAACRGR